MNIVLVEQLTFIKDMNNLQLDQLTISYDNKAFIHVDVLGYGNCIYSFIVKKYNISIIKSDFISCSDSKIFHSDLTIKEMSLLTLSDSIEGCQLGNYYINNEYSSSGTIDDCVDRTIEKNSKWVPTFE